MILFSLQGTENILLLARRTELLRISLDKPGYPSVALKLSGLQNAIAVDYDPVDGYVYWADGKTRTIQRATLAGTNQQMVVASDIYIPDGLTIDWVTRKLYWTDSRKDTIEVAYLNGTSRKVVISETLEQPRAIAVDYVGGYVTISAYCVFFCRIDTGLVAQAGTSGQ
jgi:low density lipoprotein receptor-related protein 5/6